MTGRGAAVATATARISGPGSPAVGVGSARPGPEPQGWRRQQWFEALSWDQRITLTERAAALTIASLADEAGEAAVIGKGRLARILCTNTWWSGKLLRRLAELGLIERTSNNPGGEAVYRLTLPEMGGHGGGHG